ncbi:MAG: serine/threonine protein kinase [Anaerolineae bacterium]|nr:serine/threonine protein kinase [Anaerolineae bacterium]
MALKHIGRYQVKSELDRGGMSVVYLAHDPRVQRDVAIKMLPRDVRDQPNVRKRFEREARTIAALEHPCIVPIYDFGEEDRQPYLVMRYMTGGSLADRLNRRTSLAQAARIVSRIASGLDEAHAKGVVHRDLKPGNILFDANDQAFLSDFGIVKLTETSQTSSATGATGTLVLGTPAYMSPEQALGKPIDRRSDIYALGAVLYEMLTGLPPYTGPTGMSVAMKHVVESTPDVMERRPDMQHARSMSCHGPGAAWSNRLAPLRWIGVPIPSAPWKAYKIASDAVMSLSHAVSGGAIRASNCYTGAMGSHAISRLSCPEPARVTGTRAGTPGLSAGCGVSTDRCELSDQCGGPYRTGERARYAYPDGAR